ncbi:hypothetical protein L2E82_03190 [Cichorium intybus]|uniref:Uncharacterized protein n=1 Tax=Cichorium intybus TaxID=13427 RepID=A0ACB9H336_CICIN|nr:hypothetical protein L2E82_03190 [Cichorium intybus]
MEFSQRKAKGNEEVWKINLNPSLLRPGLNAGGSRCKKAKLYAKVGKQVVSAVKKGGPNPVSNTTLAALLEKAKELDVPKEILEINIKRASDKGQEAYIGKIYEVREVVKDCGGNMVDSGSIMFKSRRARIVNVKVTDVDKDNLLSIALNSGADDVIEPFVDEDDSEEDMSERALQGTALFRDHVEGQLKNEIMSKPHLSVEPDPELPLALLDQKEAGKRLLLITNSDYIFTDKMMRHSFNRFLPNDMNWRDLFEMVSQTSSDSLLTFFFFTTNTKR